jgi:Holliday junction DNA helicase RuvA
MIAYLSGKIIYKLNDSIILLVNGVGYQVYISVELYSKIKEGENLELFIYSHIKEDCFDLLGFKTKEELMLFKMLLSVSGVGPKTALLVIGKGVEQINNAILKADVGFFSQIPRLGLKNSQKIIIELKNKLGGMADLDLSSETKESIEVVEALQSMGYTKKQAIDSLKCIADSEAKTVEERIVLCLRSIGGKK